MKWNTLLLKHKALFWRAINIGQSDSFNYHPDFCALRTGLNPSYFNKSWLNVCADEEDLGEIFAHFYKPSYDFECEIMVPNHKLEDIMKIVDMDYVKSMSSYIWSQNAIDHGSNKADPLSEKVRLLTQNDVDFVDSYVNESDPTNSDLKHFLTQILDRHTSVKMIGVFDARGFLTCILFGFFALGLFGVYDILPQKIGANNSGRYILNAQSLLNFISNKFIFQNLPFNKTYIMLETDRKIDYGIDPDQVINWKVYQWLSRTKGFPLRIIQNVATYSLKTKR